MEGNTMKVINYLEIMLLVAFYSCQKDHDTIDLHPVAFFKMAPVSGNTTTIFQFDADSSTGQGTRDNPILVRWDWDADGTWDQMYSAGSKITHRFFKPGNYTIIMEASSLKGNCDTMSIGITIPRGYSAPRADFMMTPDSANITTTFTFNASLSKDDEDSLDQLEFRWDFDGGNRWDTEFSKYPIVEHRYATNLHYSVRLEVRDPQQMTSIKTNTLIVTRLNDRIVPVVTHECWPCTIEDTIHYNASGSYYIDHPNAKLLYSWDLNNDNIWEVTLNESPFYDKIIGVEGKRAIKLRVTDDQGLYMERMDTVELYPWNSPPVTKLTLANRIGNTKSTIYMHLIGSSDRDESIMNLVAHWDINNDGVWEPEYEGLREVYLTFPEPGKFPVTAALTDTKGKTTRVTDTVWIVSGSHETGLLQDKRDCEIPVYYGTVKIGNRWWMQSNLKYQPPADKIKYWSAVSYNNNTQISSRYGMLYPQISTTFLDPAPCPPGWHVPTLVEWQQMMTDLGQDSTIARLLEGGQSELHLLLAGQKMSKFSGLEQLANYWTSTINPTGQAWAWYIDPVRKQNKAVVVSRSYYFPIRCIKNE